MTFHDVINDIKKLVGLELPSIRPGASICITKVDEEHSCILLKTTDGTIRSRPMSELQIIWNELNRTPAVHVDEALHGSGTSRNQPETILANLPYVEWLKLGNKKHIAYVGKQTHPYGTLRQMDPIEASKINFSRKNDHSKTRIIIITDNISKTISNLQKSFVGVLKSLSQKGYEFENAFMKVDIIGIPSPLPVGTYTVLPQASVSDRQNLLGAKTIRINEQDLYYFEDGENKLLIEK